MNRFNFEKIINQNSDIIYTIKEQDSAYLKQQKVILIYTEFFYIIG